LVREFTSFIDIKKKGEKVLFGGQKWCWTLSIKWLAQTSDICMSHCGWMRIDSADRNSEFYGQFFVLKLTLFDPKCWFCCIQSIKRNVTKPCMYCTCCTLHIKCNALWQLHICADMIFCRDGTAVGELYLDDGESVNLRNLHTKISYQVIPGIVQKKFGQKGLIKFLNRNRTALIVSRKCK
jgi:hypothetical protein